MRDLVVLALSNFTVTFFAIGLAASALAIAHHPPPRSRAVVGEALVRWYLFFPIGVAMLYNFVMHTFFGEMAAKFIGWADSPFQAEVGLASLGFAVVAFLALRGDWRLRFAAIAGPACFLVGAGIGHVYQIATTHNMAPGNAGAVLYTDFLVPLIGFALLWGAYRAQQVKRPARAKPARPAVDGRT